MIAMVYLKKLKNRAQKVRVLVKMLDFLKSSAGAEGELETNVSMPRGKQKKKLASELQILLQ